MLKTHTYGKRNIGGAIPHYVTREGSDEIIGSIDEVFSDVFYIRPYAPGRMYADNKRYRSLEAALKSPEWN